MSRPKSIDRDGVLDAAESIVVTGGAAGLTIDAVAKAVGVTKGGVQSCFGNKENLIAAMLARWGDQYDAAQADTARTNPDATAVQRHIKVTAAADDLNKKAASLLAALLQSKDQMAWVRSWYAGHLNRIETSTDEGRRARLAFLACEGAFMLRQFGLLEMSEAQWADIFRDIERCAAPAPRAGEQQ